MAKLYNLARMSTATTGTGTITLGSAVTGYLSFVAAGVADGETVTYAIQDGSNSEIGRGVYTSSGTTLSRSPLRSTNSNAAISLSGSAQVFITPSAEDFGLINNTLGAYGVRLAAGTNVTDNRTLTLTTGDADRTIRLNSAQHAPPGRLTLSTGVPVMTSTVAATGTLYYTPYVGNTIWLYDGSSGWDMLTFSELSIALSAGTASRPHDVFVYNNSGTATLELTAWTNTTTRATNLTFQDGRYVKTGATTRLYLGTVYLDGSKQCQWTLGSASAGGGAATLGVWNNYNRRRVFTVVHDSTSSWTYGTASWRSANNSTSNRVTFITGLAEDTWSAQYTGVATNSASGYAYRGIGYDSTSAKSGYPGTNQINSVATFAMAQYSALSSGYHYVQALEYMSGGTGTFYGDASGLGLIMSNLSFDFMA